MKTEYVKENIEEISKDYLDPNISVADIEKKYGVSYSTIRRVLYRQTEIVNDNPSSYKYQYVHDHVRDFIFDYTQTRMSYAELEKKYQCPKSTIKSMARQLDIKRTPRFKFIDHQQLITDWNSHQYSMKQLEEKYKVSYITVRKILENNLDDYNPRYGRRYFFNEKYFDVINTEHKAYWLGFIYADGSHYPQRNSLRIILQEDDRHILEQFYRDVECERTLDKIFNKEYKKYYVAVTLQSMHLSESLLRQGVPGDKSFKIRFPPDEIVPLSLKKHFIRGYFDGDGSITIPKNGMQKVAYSFTGNADFIKSLHKFLISEVNSNFKNIEPRKHYNSDVYVLSRGGRYKAQEFLDWLYKDATIYLHRKYDKYQKIKTYNEVHNEHKISNN